MKPIHKPIKVTDLIGETAIQEHTLTIPKVGDIVQFALRAINDGNDIQVFPAIVLEPKGTSARLKIFRETFDEYITKAPQSAELQPGFFTCKN
jgi:hypothetical protein